MMYRALLFTGLLLLTPVVHGQSSADKEDTLYKRIRGSLVRELENKKLELPVQSFVTGEYYHHIVKALVPDPNGGADTTEDFEVKEEDVLAVREGNSLKLCGEKNHLSFVCTIATDTIQQITERALWPRRLARRLQTIASGYEGAIYGYPGSPVNIAVRLPSIANIWRSGSDPFMNPFVESYVRAIPLPAKDTVQSDVQGLISTMEDTLIRKKTAPDGSEMKDDTQFTAAVWRYRNGVRYTEQEEGACSSAPDVPTDHERLYQLRRYCDVEDKLKQIHSSIMAQAVIDPPQQAHEQVLFPSITDKEKNIIVWIRSDDIGLQWYIPVEPVHAALMHPKFTKCLEDGKAAKDCAQEADSADSFLVPGGTYPEPVDGSGSRVREPDEGKGLCSHPFARRGYLCRNVQSEACGLIAEDTEQINDEDITDLVLTGCEPERFRDDIYRKVSGQDACVIGGWKAPVDGNVVKDTPELQDDMRPNACTACAVDVLCADDCNGSTDAALTAISRSNGVVRICMPKIFGETGDLEYLMAHELVHAQQFCRLSEMNSYAIFGHYERDANGDGTMDEDERKAAAAGCCSMEREAYFTQCKMMATDGVLNQAGVTVDQCASAFANYSCKPYAKSSGTLAEKLPCTDDGVDPDDIRKKIDVIVKQNRNLPGPAASPYNGKLVPTSCADLVNKPTARIQALYESMPFSCAPGCQSRYANTIGNNLCYTAQCVEEGNEFARPVAGRSALGSMEQAFPEDSCQLPDPEIAGVADLPALTGPKLPPYRPGELFLKLDTALCRLNGLPARALPVTCIFDPRRRIALPLLSSIDSVASLAEQPNELKDARFGLQEASDSIAAMTVTEMYDLYLGPAARQFADMVDLARQMLATLGETAFPKSMCPRIIESAGFCSDME